MVRRKWWFWSATALALCGGIGWAAFKPSKEKEILYTSEVVRRGDLRESVSANGEIQALSRVNVGTSVSGEIKEIHVKDGSWVKAGDLLVTIDQERYRQDLNHADLSLRSAKQDLQNAQAIFDKQNGTYARQLALFKQGLISEDQFQDAKLAQDNTDNGLQRARVAVQQAESQVALSKDALAKTILRAPMAGRVTGLIAEKGETAIAGQTNVAGAVLMVISDMAEMVAEAKVGELDVVKLRPGQPAEIQVDAMPGKVLQGVVLNVSSSADRAQNSLGMGGSQEAQNYKVRVKLTGTKADLEPLRPGMSARVAVLVGEAKQVITVPLMAVQEREERSGGLGLMPRTRTTVFVLANGKAEERTLRAGASTRRSCEVVEGLKEGEMIITGPAKGFATLSSGKAVKLAPDAPAAKP